MIAIGSFQCTYIHCMIVIYKWQFLFIMLSIVWSVILNRNVHNVVKGWAPVSAENPWLYKTRHCCAKVVSCWPWKNKLCKYVEPARLCTPRVEKHMIIISGMCRNILELCKQGRLGSTADSAGTTGFWFGSCRIPVGYLTRNGGWGGCPQNKHHRKWVYCHGKQVTKMCS